ncbi:endonuclease G, mitochondrial [Trypanosoma conorhini]|uniref:Endonuclease G, mitochondrial n=1 Tax=Trypanosoma conorhini TaxID=83891 RepID=A0A3R7L1G7_9TRYP|nr:endonuclease G, mitochondrial [Trypanosoma conorhini]RNF05691.1 endonuclease G, mitochondrial [Trypanosoma conorhini]
MSPSFKSAAALGRAFALLSATFVGAALGVMTERAGGRRPGHELPGRDAPSPLREAAGVDAAPPPLSPLMQKTVSKGLPSDERVRFFDGFVASLNYERRIPNWVLEYIPGPAAATATPRGGDSGGGGDDESSLRAKREGMKFFADTTVPETFRVSPDDYGGGREEERRLRPTRGLSRGHLAAAQFHKTSPKEMAETFNMNANIVPQDMTMNAVDWLRLENLTKKLLRRYEGGLWVVTGPVFHPRHVYGDPRAWGWTESRSTSAITPAVAPDDVKKARKVVCYELVGKHDVAVPTHLFKVLLGERSDGTHEVAAFLMPNEPITDERPLVAYQVTVAEVEKKTGLQFFRNALAAKDVATAPSWRARKAPTHGLDALPDICGRHSCEVRTAALFQSYRCIAQLRAAQSLPELQQVFNRLLLERQQQQQRDNANGAQLDAFVVKEYMQRKKELVEAAVAEVD